MDKERREKKKKKREGERLNRKKGTEGKIEQEQEQKGEVNNKMIKRE